MRTSTLIFYSLFMCFVPVYGQFSEMVGKPYNQRVEAINRLYWIAHEDRAMLADTLTAMREWVEKFNDKELRMEADLLEVFYDSKHSIGTPDFAPFQAIIERAQRDGMLHIACRGNQLIANHYWHTKDYERAFRYYGRQDALFRAISADDFPDKILYLKEIGEAYYHFGDYDRAINYFEQATEEPHPFFEYAWKHSMNTMGLAYQQLGNLAKGDSCFLQLLTHNHPDTEIWEGIVAGNLGYSQYLQGNYEEARPLLEKDIRIAEKYQDFGLAAGSCIPLASILTGYGQLREARTLLDKAAGYILESGQTDRQRHLYPAMSRWYMAAGQPREAARYLDSALVAEKHYHEKFSGLLLMRASQEVMASQREAALQKLRGEGQREINRRNLLLSGMALLLVVVVGIGYWQRQRDAMRTKDQALRLLETERDLQRAREQLETLARQAAKSEEAAKATKDRELIEQLQQQVVLTDEGWARFSQLFGRLHPGFQHTLRERYPELTPAEIRCLAMEKLNYTNKEMAALQGISANAVAVTKHRIRKKLGVVSQEDLERLVKGV